MFATDSKFAKNDRVPWRLIENEAILIDIEEGEVLRLNQVGAEIWNAIDGARTVEDIVFHICNTFEVSHRVASKDVNRFLKQLLRCELIEERSHVSLG